MVRTAKRLSQAQATHSHTNSPSEKPRESSDIEPFTSPAPESRISLKEERKLERKQNRNSRNHKSSSPDTDSGISSTSHFTQPLFDDSSMTTNPTRLPLLIVSIGNPLIKASPTRHDAGHVLLAALRQNQAHLPSNWSFWSSSSYMNISGSGVKKTYKNWPHRSSGGKLVVLQDELELELGALRVRSGWNSPKGHNGIKSIQSSLPRDAEWERICIGIGRPVSRDVDSVSNYVLGKLSREEREVFGGRKVEEAIGLLRKVAA